MVATANLFHGIAATYPQDTRNCNACHAGAAQGAQAISNPSQLACKGCHDYVSFTASETSTCQIMGNLARGTDGKPLPCNHVAGPQPDDQLHHLPRPDGGFLGDEVPPAGGRRPIPTNSGRSPAATRTRTRRTSPRPASCRRARTSSRTW